MSGKKVKFHSSCAASPPPLSPLSRPLFVCNRHSHILSYACSCSKYIICSAPPATLCPPASFSFLRGKENSSFCLGLEWSCIYYSIIKVTQGSGFSWETGRDSSPRNLVLFNQLPLSKFRATFTGNKVIVSGTTGHFFLVRTNLNFQLETSHSWHCTLREICWPVLVPPFHTWKAQVASLKSDQ